MNHAWVRRGALAVAFAISIPTGTSLAGEPDALSLAMTLPSPNALPVPGGQPSAMKTYQLHIHYDARETINLTFNSRSWFYAEDRSGPRLLRTYYTGGSVFYNSLDGKAWEKIDYARLSRSLAPQSPHSVEPAKRPVDQAHVARWLPDRTVAGRRYRNFGVFATNTRPAPTLIVSCLVDARSGLLRRCKRPGIFSATFDHYGDPGNEFVVPAAVRRARDVTNS